MPSIDMPLEQLRQYKPSLYREQDFDSFWDSTIKDALRQPINAELVPYDLPAKNLECFAVRFDGFEGGRLAGWYIRPSLSGKFPGLCMYHGYSGRGTRLLDMVHLATQGICVLSMDCRGQNGQSQDLSQVSEGHSPGWMTQGIRDPRKYYYRYVYADAVRALEMLAKRDEVDFRVWRSQAEARVGDCRWRWRHCRIGRCWPARISHSSVIFAAPSPSRQRDRILRFRYFSRHFPICMNSRSAHSAISTA